MSVTVALKELQFTWTAATGATHYRLFESVDGTGPGFAQVGSDLTGTSYSHMIGVHTRMNAAYRLDACNAVFCTPSNFITPGSTLAQAIGYFKAPNNGVEYYFGTSVALSADGTTLAVAQSEEAGDNTGVNSTPNANAVAAGAVYVFVRGASGWAQQAYIKPSHALLAFSFFGRGVALSADGSTLAVGVPGDSSDNNGINGTPDQGAANAGAAYVFTRSGTTWSQQAYIKASNSTANHLFGSSVALNGDGNTLAVGATASAVGTGTAYVFTRSATTWSEQQTFSGTNSDTNDRFGGSVALSTDGNTLAVGARLEDSSSTGVNSTANEGAANSGAAYVFTRTGTLWSQQAYIKASNTGAGDAFGNSVALSGDGNTLAVGAPEEDSGSTGINSTPNEAGADSGAVYVFVRSAGVWSQQAYIKTSNAQAGDLLGDVVALSTDGNTLAVSAFGEDGSGLGVNSTPNETATESGAAYTFTRSGTTWSQQAYVKAKNTEASDAFGAVALSGDGNTLAVGASCEASSSTGINSAPNENLFCAGAVYLY